jgi:hypothetical protein
MEWITTIRKRLVDIATPVQVAFKLIQIATLSR